MLDFLAAVDIVPLDDVVCRIFARERGRLRAAGTPLGDFDLLIGATAIRHGLTLLTNNRRHFERSSTVLEDCDVTALRELSTPPDAALNRRLVVLRAVQQRRMLARQRLAVLRRQINVSRQPHAVAHSRHDIALHNDFIEGIRHDCLSFWRLVCVGTTPPTGHLRFFRRQHS